MTQRSEFSAECVDRASRSPTVLVRARHEGATDREIHDAVLIAAAFCMFNRYVDGLATLTPTDEHAYDMMGQRMAKDGYVRANR